MNLFDQDDAVDPNKNYLEEFVGDGKKFSSVEELAKAKAEADAFIERLKGETAGLRQELNTRLKLEEAVERLSARQQPPSSEPEPKAPEQGTEKKSATPEELETQIQKILDAERKKTQRERNFAAVERALQDAFGPTYKRAVTEQAKKLGLGEEFLSNLAAEQPAAFLKLLDVNRQPEANSTATTAPRTSVSSEALGFKPGDGVKRQSYYDKIKKADPKRYWSPQVQNELHREAIRQGESFFD